MDGISPSRPGTPADLLELARRFQGCEQAQAVKPLGEGNVHTTYCVAMGGGPVNRVVLQRLNTEVFPRPELVIENMERCCLHLEERLRSSPPQALDDQRWEVPSLIPSRDGGSLVEQDGALWRAQRFVEGSRVVQAVDDPGRARELGFGLGLFHNLIGDLPPEHLHDTLPGFHVTPLALMAYDEAMETCGATDGAEERFCHAFVRMRRDLAPLLEEARSRGALTLRPVHGDPKVNNVLLDAATGKAVALIDLDTVKPGLPHTDIGDCLRSACNRLGEETDVPDAVHFDADLCEAVLEGYLRGMGGALSAAEQEHLHGAARLISFELGLRFLTDHLRGDTYFRTRFRGHNLRRACVQFQLTASIEAQEQDIRARIDRLADTVQTRS
ncbi:aminoglycoside phosphotransferase family protein [Synechococcus sp. RSCCF101]|uniref:phosphotransferase enzyme family protein n=1 Tax=Synechococcus sp. RSCCF101 TaxID=2511069 RepID=UPI001243C8D9|nr:phosphotransferase [Synechococcus sp. RSCCF101]QEY31575.1 aminoglycoside phosphotransferase family protein [Synechococcus sp. RSCCF101]